MTRDELYIILKKNREWETDPEAGFKLIWGQPFDGLTEKINAKDEGEDCRTTRQRLKMANNAIRIAVDAFEEINMWEGDNGSTDMHDCLKDFLPIPTQHNTTKSDSSTSPVTEDSSATGSESIPNGTTYTRSYQVFLPTPPTTMSNPNMNDLRKKIESAINSASAETGSDTPDFILAEYLTDCLAAFNKAAMAREKWYGRPLPEPCCPFFEEHPRKMDEEYDEEEHRRL